MFLKVVVLPSPWIQYRLHTLQSKKCIHYAARIRSFSSHPNLRRLWLNLGGCWFPAFITICVSLGVRCSAPPPGGTYTNEDTTSNEHPPPSVLNYSAAPLPEPTRHPELPRKNPGWNTSATKPLRPREPKQKTHVRVRHAAAAPCSEGVAVRPCVRVSAWGRGCLFITRWAVLLFDISWNKL